MKFRIVFIITGLDIGGAEMMLLKLCSKFDKSRFSLVVISLTDKGRLGHSFEEIGIPVFTLGIDRGKFSVFGFFRLRSLILSLRPNLLQGWMYHGNLAASLATSRFIPVVWGIRQSLYELTRERLLTRWVIRIGALISKSYVSVIVYNSLTSAKQHLSFGFSPPISNIIPNGFDCDVFCPNESARLKVRQELGLSDRTILIGLICRFHPMKDHKNFFRAAALLTNNFPDTHFLLAGHGIDKDNLNLVSMIKDYGLSNRVFMLGERQDIPKLNAALDIATSSSSWGEGFANAIGEAMSCCVPCVVTNIGDSAWIVGDTGIVVPPCDANALSSAWKHLIELNSLQRKALGALARERIKNKFSINLITIEYENLYIKTIIKSRDKLCADS